MAALIILLGVIDFKVLLLRRLVKIGVEGVSNLVASRSVASER